MMGKELDGLSFKELQHLEHLLSEGILSVKDKKVFFFSPSFFLFYYFFPEPRALLYSSYSLFQEQVLLELLDKSRMHVRQCLMIDLRTFLFIVFFSNFFKFSILYIYYLFGPCTPQEQRAITENESLRKQVNPALKLIQPTNQ